MNPLKPRMRGRAAVVLAASATLGAAAASVALAAGGPPSVSTGSARGITFGSAVLTGSLNPRGSETSYYFQYGPTRAYGGQSAIASVSAGTRTVRVSLPILGLKPITRYHYRLIAINRAGAATGRDRVFMTTKVPLSLQILAAPNPVTFGGAITVQGTLSGTDSANRAVVLQANPFPYIQGFVTLGNPLLTAVTGGFSFPVIGLTQATQFRVITTTNPPVVSPVVIESVAVRVSAHVGRTGRRRRARFFGTVAPAEDGMQVGILKFSHGRYVLVGGTYLRHRNASSSRFSRVLRVSRGIYRVLVRITDGAHSSAYSAPLRIG